MSKEKKARVSEAATEERDDVVGSETGDSAESDSQSPGSEDEQVTSGGAELSDPTVEIASLEQQIADLKDQLLRKQADFENFRKRMVREREEAIRFANTNLLLDLVETIDNFERAIKSSEESRDFESFHTGVDMIEKQLTSMLENKYGLKRFESDSQEFDPELHEAVAAEESPDVTVQTVLDVLQKGYMLHDRVLRHAKVRVAVPSAKDQENNSE
jgi:molecular chaperone GrpE